MRRSNLGTLPWDPRYMQLVLGFLVIVVLWGEWLSYILYARLFWPAIDNDNINILLVADPQLIGYKNENWLIGWLTRWDSDRYLRRGYSLAKEHVRFKSTIFLGDLIDEGVEGTEDQFRWTVTRFETIFRFQKEGIQRVYIAGDNDVGGEMEPVWANLKSRFKTSFPNKIDKFSKLADFKITEISFFEWPPTQTKILSQNGTDAIQIILSHSPISPAMKLTNKEVRSISPDLILSAHDHSAWYHVSSRKDSSMNSTQLDSSTVQVKGTFGKDLPVVELQVPTCSYRMGTTTIGYGVLSLSKTSRSSFDYSFTILWMPSRFLQLILYSVAVILVISMHLLPKLFSRRRYHSTHLF